MSTTLETDETAVYVWFARPDVGRDSVLMVIVNDPTHGPTYRPLIAVDQATADAQAPLAQAAANDLGVTAELVEFRLHQLHDRLEPQQ